MDERPVPDDVAGPEIYFGTNRDIGRVTQFGNIAIGTELIFKIAVRQTGHAYFSGPPSRNSDGLAHADVTCLGGGSARFTFEDGGDQSYNDLRFEVSLEGCASGDAGQISGGSSPIGAPQQDDTLFSVDQGPSLDTGCSYRSGGPLVIQIPITRYVGPVGPGGDLVDPAGLVAIGVLSATATLRLPAWDVDVSGQPVPERDRVIFNGHDLGYLTGANNLWRLNEFRIPIAWVKFPSASVLGTTPTPRTNVIQINIDGANSGDPGWCTAVDWASIEFDAIAPVVLVHGINADGNSWAPGFTSYFAGLGMPWSKEINLPPNGKIEDNAAVLRDQLARVANAFGAKRVHLVCHSKGGLDTRAI